MKTLILGAGGIGGYYGARLIQSGAEVDFLVRPARAELLRRNGLVVKSPLGDAHCPVNAVTSVSATPGAYGLVMLSCKAYDLDAAMDAIAPAVEGGAMVLPLLNGMAHMDRLDARFGRSAVMGGVAHISTTLAPDGSIHHLNKLQRIFAGPRDAAQADEVHARLQGLATCGIAFSESPDIEARMWDKWVFLATLAAATTALRASIGTILETTHGKATVLGLLDECLAVAATVGHRPEAEQLETYRNTLTEAGSALKASMLRDLESGGRTEAEHVIGDMVKRAGAGGVEVPLLRFALTHLQAYELQRVRA
ncbi:MAG: 2-dehydropantoate 2-reductase [Pseudazoarcus pumilus]|nr:2-dehydropantoate 2-reductase [Pseudazoarcus pumilus]